MKSKTLQRIILVVILPLSPNIFANKQDSCVFQGKLLSASEISKNTQTLGYKVCSKHQAIKLDDCIYKVKAEDKAGQKWKLYFDPITGNLISKKAKK